MDNKDKVRKRYPCAVLEKHRTYPGAILIHDFDFAVFDRPYDPDYPGRMLLGYGNSEQAAWNDSLRYIHGCTKEQH